MDTHLLQILKEYQEKNKMVANSTIKDFYEILLDCNEKLDETSIMAILVIHAYIVTILYYAYLNKICASHIYYVH
jgi:hypothetical protein